MKNFSLLLLLSFLLVTPVRVSAVGSEKAEEEKSEIIDPYEETVRYTKEEENKEVIEESKEKGNPNFSPRGFIERRNSASNEGSVSSQENVALNFSEETERLEEENHFDLTTLEQGEQEAREIVAELTGKGAAIEEAELQNLFQEWSKRHEYYKKASEAFQQQNNSDIGGQQIKERLEELLQASAGVVKTLKQGLNNFVENETRIDASARQKRAQLLWEEKLKDQDFQTKPDGAVFWTGHHWGNKEWAEKYARRTGKQTLEMTKGGKLLEQQGFHDRESPQSDAHLLWSYASERFTKQAAGHVVAFVLAEADPFSVYHRDEKDWLLENDAVFLSEVIKKSHASFLTEEAQKELKQVKVLESFLHGLLSQAKTAWEEIGDYSEFEEKKIEKFLGSPTVKEVAALIEQELYKLSSEPLASFVEKATELPEVWTSIYDVVYNLRWKGVKDAQLKVSHLHKKIKQLEGIETVSEAWSQEYEWLQEARQFLDYQIFKAYRDQGNLESAKRWREACRKFEEEQLSKILKRPAVLKELEDSNILVSDVFFHTKSYTSIKNNLTILQKLEVARKLHEEQERKRRAAHTALCSSFQNWQLPFAEKKTLALEEIVSSRMDEKNTEEKLHFILPARLKRELEALGRVYFAQVNQEIEHLFTPDIKKPPFAELSLEKEITTSEASETQSEKVSNPSLYQTLQTWTLAQLEDPTLIAQHQPRWEKRREILLLRQEADRLARIIDQEAEGQKQRKGSDFATPSFKKDPEMASTLFTSISFLSSLSKGTKKNTAIDNKPVTLESLQKEFSTVRTKEKEASKIWRSLANEKENEIGIPIKDEDEVIDAWAKADDLAIEEQDKREEAREMKRDAQQIKEHWASFMNRLEERSQADRATEELKKLEAKERELAKKQKGLSESECIKQEKELEKELEKWSEIQKQARTAWETKAQQSHTKKPLENLIEEDRSVLTRWDYFTEKKNLDLDKRGEEQLQLYRYSLSSILTEKEEAAFAPSQKNQNVATASKQYLQAACQEALLGARKKIPGAEIAWRVRLEEDKKQLENLEKNLQDPLLSHKEKATLQHTQTQLQALSNSNEEAFKLFQKENRRLNQIEKIWEKIEQGIEEETFQKARHAAEQHRAGDTSAWEKLSLTEKEKYNEKIEEENTLYKQEIAAEESFLKKVRNELQKKEIKAQRFLSPFIGGLSERQKEALDFLKQARSYYDERHQQLTERKEMLHVGEMTVKERKDFIRSQKTERSFKEYNIPNNKRSPSCSLS